VVFCALLSYSLTDQNNSQPDAAQALAAAKQKAAAAARTPSMNPLNVFTPRKPPTDRF